MTSRGRYRYVLLAGVLALASCKKAVLAPAGPVAADEKTIIIDSLIIMLAIVVPTILGTLGFAWWFRASNKRARYLRDWTYSGRVELVTWSIPLLTITLLGGVAWVGSHRLDPAAPVGDPRAEPLDIQGVALDWKWLFIYPGERVATLNVLNIPAGRPLRFSLTSASVLNTFFVPELGTMIYTMYGMTSRLNLVADKPGDLWGRSTMIDGDGFPEMHFDVHALTADGFRDWVARARAGGPTLDDGAYVALSKQAVQRETVTYASVSPGLYDRIVSQALPAGPGPEPKPQVQSIPKAPGTQ